MLFYKTHIAAVLKELQTSEKGLSSKEAAARLERDGPNLLRVSGEPLWKKIIEPFRSIFMLVLGLAAIISFFMDERLDAIIILATIIVSATIYYVQRISSERVLNALKKHDQQIIRTLRSGERLEISSEELVVGDVVELFEGEKVPADIRIISADNVRADEALLTGESLPIGKDSYPLTNDKEIYERTNMLYQGSFIVAGQTLGVVVATANDTEFGQLAALAEGSNTASPVQEKIDALLKKVILVVGIIAAVVFCLSLWRGIELLEALRFMITVAVSAVPESLPIAISVVLVLGMRRMAKYQALVRNLRAIENVGVVTTIATDKTGTLTKNELSVHDVWQLHAESDLKSVANEVALVINGGAGGSKDPLDHAFSQFADEYNGRAPEYLSLSRNLPFDQDYAMSGAIWQDNKGKTYSYVKGAPEKVMALCHLPSSSYEKAEHALHSLTGQGLRVIALAKAVVKSEASTIEQLQKVSFAFVGFVAVADSLRPEAKSAIAATKAAGVTVRMITGDHFETAFAIGKQLGLATHRDQVFDARQMNDLSDEELREVVARVRVFARVVPENKHKILSILKETEVAAMTGDGVNDVPALANAHIGVAMGSGSQIAKDAGDIVLLNDSFLGIVEALREGRIIFDNIRRMLYYLFATNAGQVMTIVASLLMGLPLPFLPVQILWINLVTDTAMVIPLGLEPAEDDVMNRKPRKANRPIIGRVIIGRMVVVAAVMAVVSLGTFIFYLQNHSIAYAQTIAFSAMVAMQWANAFNARSERQSLFTRMKVFNGKFYAGLSIAITLQCIALFGPLQSALHIDTSVTLIDLAISSIVGIAAIIGAAEIHKLYSKKKYVAAGAIGNARVN